MVTRSRSTATLARTLDHRVAFARAEVPDLWNAIAPEQPARGPRLGRRQRRRRAAPRAATLPAAERGRITDVTRYDAEQDG